MPAWLNEILEGAHEALTTTNRSARITFARDLLNKRGANDDLIQRHGIGFVGSSFSIKECTPEFHQWSQQFLHDCITFPIYNMVGEPIGLQIRVLDSTEHTRPYKQYYAYHRDIFPYFYGLPDALPHIYKTGYVVIVEGVFDYYAVRQCTPNVLAVFTSGVPVACKRFFKRFCKRVVALLDMDTPGREGAERLVRDADDYSVIVPTYSEKDPGDLFTKGKLSELQKIITQTSNLLVR